eukprot:TRINITY_DN2039_c0_g1_i3.p2 TRINITY_DN2039_c0_g1~~TRINITY_DN2039_c0_g1_i3.p2  ORF type:complete len:134 (+),score=19.74 TRINITY_DN2039_c0_g1_i3:104-505(+)
MTPAMVIITMGTTDITVITDTITDMDILIILPFLHTMDITDITDIITATIMVITDITDQDIMKLECTILLNNKLYILPRWLHPLLILHNPSCNQLLLCLLPRLFTMKTDITDTMDTTDITTDIITDTTDITGR